MARRAASRQGRKVQAEVSTNRQSALRYVGGGEFIWGVPARDLSREEAERFGSVIEAHERTTGRRLYEPAGEQTTDQPAEEVTEEEGE